MRYRTITIGREYGSGGAEIAEAVARSLGWKLLDRTLLQEIATRAGVPENAAAAVDEHVDPWLYRVLRPVVGRGADGMTAALPVEVFDADAAAEMAGAVIGEAYGLGGCVIVGRGAQCVLAGRPDVLHVFIYAPEKDRIRRVRERLPRGADAYALLHKVDKCRMEYVRQHYGQNRMDPHLYDLMINSHGAVPRAVTLILDAVDSKA